MPEFSDSTEPEAGRRVTPDQHALSPREAEILALISKGCSNFEIAERLYLSMNTVKSHIRAAYRKIGATTRTQAVIWCFHHGLARADPRVTAAGAPEASEENDRHPR